LSSSFLPDLFDVEEVAMAVNAGLNRVRFLAPVIRSRARERLKGQLGAGCPLG
jgi:hypothetical protein